MPSTVAGLLQTAAAGNCQIRLPLISRKYSTALRLQISAERRCTSARTNIRQIWWWPKRLVYREGGLFVVTCFVEHSGYVVDHPLCAVHPPVFPLNSLTLHPKCGRCALCSGFAFSVFGGARRVPWLPRKRSFKRFKNQEQSSFLIFLKPAHRVVLIASGQSQPSQTVGAHSSGLAKILLKRSLHCS